MTAAGLYPIREGTCAVCGLDLAAAGRTGHRDAWANLLCERCHDVGWRIDGLDQLEPDTAPGLGWAGPVLLVLVLVGAFLLGVNAEEWGLVGWWQR